MSLIAVLGPGGVGGFSAAALSRAGERVVVVARESTAELINRNGIDVRSRRLGDFTERPHAVSTLSEAAEVLFIATKATALQSSLGRTQALPRLVVPLLNGLDHMQLLRERFGSDRVAAGTIRIESDRPAPARIIQTSQFLRIDLAAGDQRLHPQLHDTRAALERAGIPATVGDSESLILWSKLVRLNALACTTSAFDEQVGVIRTEHRAVLKACIDEACAVAKADGANIDPAARLAELDEAHPELGSSMQRDIAAGREPELDAIPGSVLRAAERHGLQCPTVAQLVAQIRERL